MPKKLERCVKQVKKQGKSESQSYAICTASLNSAHKKKKQSKK